MTAKLVNGIVYLDGGGIMHPRTALDILGAEAFRSMPHDCTDEALEDFIESHNNVPKDLVDVLKLKAL